MVLRKKSKPFSYRENLMVARTNFEARPAPSRIDIYPTAYAHGRRGYSTRTSALKAAYPSCQPVGS